MKKPPSLTKREHLFIEIYKNMVHPSAYQALDLNLYRQYAEHALQATDVAIEALDKEKSEILSLKKWIKDLESRLMISDRVEYRTEKTDLILRGKNEKN